VEVIKKTHKNAIYIEDDNNLIKFLVENTKKGDCVAFLGSHGFRNMIEEVTSGRSRVLEAIGRANTELNQELK
jgi:ribosomal protein L6P/L9E